MRYHKLKFPRDEKAHNNAIEWWYFNGNLKDKVGNQYAFMNCLFKTEVKRFFHIPFLRHFKYLHFSHSLLSDIKNQKFYPRLNSKVTISKDSFSKSLLFVKYSLNKFFWNVIEQTKKNKYHMKTEDMDLFLESTKKPLLEGGKGFLTLGSKKTYYYSLTNLKTSGRIKIKDKWIEVTGKSWADHQWANISIVEGKWTWFSIQLEDDTEIICCEYGHGKKFYFAGISYPDGNQKHFSKVHLKVVGDKWRSERTKITYPLSWEIEIPSEKINLKIQPLIKNQEMVAGIINYFEGPIKIRGTIKKKKVLGKGFIELVGYSSDRVGIDFLKEKISKKINLVGIFMKNIFVKRNKNLKDI